MNKKSKEHLTPKGNYVLSNYYGIDLLLGTNSSDWKRYVGGWGRDTYGEGGGNGEANSFINFPDTTQLGESKH